MATNVKIEASGKNSGEADEGIHRQRSTLAKKLGISASDLPLVTDSCVVRYELKDGVDPAAVALLDFAVKGKDWDAAEASARQHGDLRQYTPASFTRQQYLNLTGDQRKALTEPRPPTASYDGREKPEDFTTALR